MKYLLPTAALLATAILLAVTPASHAQPATPARPPPSTVPAAPAARAGARAAERVLRFLEDRVKRDPDDITALNRLAGIYLQKVRETGSIDYLRLADRDVRQSLAAVPAEQNLGGLLMRARLEFESHDFAAARDDGQKLARLDGDKATSFSVLGDALVELGEYDQGAAAYEQMRQLDPDSTATLARLARLEQLKGRTGAARDGFIRATAAAIEMAEPSPEAIAWCRWQLGELAFATGDYPAAEEWDREALEGSPGYFRALASLGRALGARGDSAGAIAQYEHAVAVVPDPGFLAALGDLYHLAGRDKEARQQFALVEQIAKLSALHGALYNRQVTLFRADHGVKVELAYADAVREYAVRKDVYGADAVAWCALKAGKLPEARAAAKEALRLGTPDARLLYHAGMVALASDDAVGAADLLGRALALSPRFDPVQAPVCEKALKQAREKSRATAPAAAAPR